MKELIIVRGLPGSGKSEFAELLVNMNSNSVHYDHDDYHEYWTSGSGGDFYNYNPIAQLGAWERQIEGAQSSMRVGRSLIVISDVFPYDWQVNIFKNLAEEFEYTFRCIVMENRHDGENVHNVRQDDMRLMRKNFSTKL